MIQTWHHLMTETGLGTTLAFALLMVASAAFVYAWSKR